MNKQRQKRVLLTVATIALGLLPLIVFAALWYWKAPLEAESRRQDYARITIARTNEVLGEAEAVLRVLSLEINPRCDSNTQAALARATYDSLYFHGAALIHNGTLRCIDVSILRGASPSLHDIGDQAPHDGKMHLAAPGSVMPSDPSIIALYAVQENAILALFINPSQLGATLEPVLAEQPVSVEVELADGSQLARFGRDFDRQIEPNQKLQSISRVSPDFPLRVTVTSSQDWVSQARKKSAPLYAALGITLSALLLFVCYRLWLLPLSIDAGLRNALATNQFQVHYQPVIDLDSGACIGAEALLRWHHPEHGLMMPDSFVSIAEKTGFVISMTAWIMKQVAVEMRELLDANPIYHISLNLSARHILDPDLLNTVRASFSNGVSPRRIIFEITEQELFRGRPDEVLSIVRQLRETGAGLALDDFGTGYASLKYLTQYHFDYLKIDKHFVHSIGRDAVNASLVDAIVDIAKKLGLGIVAEGIETPEQLGYVKKLGVRKVQGWLFSKALPAKEFIEYVRAGASQAMLQESEKASTQA